MAYQISNFMDNDDIKTLDQRGPFRVIEYQRDLSVTPGSAMDRLLLRSDERPQAPGGL